MSELDALVNERSAAYREKYSFENQLMAVGDKIQRLQYAVKQVDGVKDGLLSYGLEVDRIHDDMNLELARLQNEESNLQGLIGSLASRINVLCARIENFFN